jgi:hypothetical protein
MIEQEKFHEIIDKVKRHEFISPLDVEELIASMAELDANLLIAQNTVEFVAASATQQFERLGMQAVEIMGTRDHAKVKKMAKLFGAAAGQLVTAAQLFVQGQAAQAQELLNTFLDDDGVVGDDEPTAGPVGSSG